MCALPRVLLAIAVAVGLLSLRTAFSQNPQTASPPVHSDSVKPAETIGMAGCAATGCHGRTTIRNGIFDSQTWHESFALWIDRDPHTRSYRVLEGSLAQTIMKNLRHGDPSLPESATNDSRCLACHTNPSLANPIAGEGGQLQRIRAEGVSCEACHGNAEKWQIAHTNPIPAAERKKLFADWQMNDLNDWQVQVKICSGCHVGAGADPSLGLPVRDMNHDMIAAGHPRLEFDFASYQAKLSKHWQPRNRTTGELQSTTDRLEAWVYGQIGVELAYCELSLDRIRRGNREPRSPLPEFSDWNCSQCHHQLTGAAWRAKAVAEQTTGPNSIRDLGRPSWIGASSFQPANPAPRFLAPRANQEESLRERHKRLSNLQNTLAKHPESTQQYLLEFLSTSPIPVSNWEEATRTYLGLRSLENSLHARGVADANDAKFDAARQAIWNSPMEPKRKEHSANDYQRKPESRWIWESRLGFRPDTIDATLQQLRQSIAADLQKLPLPTTKP